jgi:AcrR family transcriptional regulator
MPKKTFFNLPEEKRNAVIRASKKEFSRVPLANALVANIVLDAKIPRGSFYQYFEDIEDCFYYVVDEYSKDIKTRLINNLKEYNGDIIKAYHNLFLYILDMIDEEDNKDYFKNLFLNMNYRIQQMFTPNFNDGLNNIINIVNISKLNIQSRFALGYILDIIESIMIHNIIESYKRNMPRDKKVEIFEKEIILVSMGIVKNK